MPILANVLMVTKASKPTISTLPDPSIGGSLVKMVVALVVLGGCAWLVKRRAAGRPQGRSLFRPTATKARSGLRVISRQTLGKGAFLAVVEWEGREVLVGITNAGISFYEEPGLADTAAKTTAQPLARVQETSQIAPIPFPSNAMDLLAKPKRSGILDLLREQTVRH